MKDTDTPEAAALSEEIHQTVNRAVEELPEDLRTAIILREIEGLTQAGSRCWVVRETSFDGFELEFQGWAALCS